MIKYPLSHKRLTHFVKDWVDTKEEGIFSRSIYYSLARIFRRNYHTLCFICIVQFLQLIVWRYQSYVKTNTLLYF